MTETNRLWLAIALAVAALCVGLVLRELPAAPDGDPGPVSAEWDTPADDWRSVPVQAPAARRSRVPTPRPRVSGASGAIAAIGPGRAWTSPPGFTRAPAIAGAAVRPPAARWRSAPARAPPGACA